MNKTKLIFSITTSILALMYLGGGSRYFLEFQEMSDIFTTLQFPRWLHPLLGVTKFMAVISLLTILFNVKANPNRLKEWTYAGIFFNGTLALIAHLMIGEPFELYVPAIMVIVFVIISRISWGKLNNATNL
jgi:cytochrome b subunit of formate dehydrogenase